MAEMSVAEGGKAGKMNGSLVGGPGRRQGSGGEEQDAGSLGDLGCSLLHTVITDARSPGWLKGWEACQVKYSYLAHDCGQVQYAYRYGETV